MRIFATNKYTLIKRKNYFIMTKKIAAAIDAALIAYWIKYRRERGMPVPELTDEQQEVLKSFRGWASLRSDIDDVRTIPYAAFNLCSDFLFGLGRFSEQGNMFKYNKIPTAQYLANAIFERRQSNSYIYYISMIESALVYTLMYHKEGTVITENIRSMSVFSDSYFTPQPLCEAMWKIAIKAGFTGGSVLEPCCGIGSVLMAMPKELNVTQIVGIDPDEISCDMLKAAMPNVKVIKGLFEQQRVADFDLVITNVPFGAGAPNDKSMPIKIDNKHDYFIAKSLMALRNGGIAVIVTSCSTMDRVTNDTRKQMANKLSVDLVAAFRMPSGTFKDTAVSTDILVFRKRDDGDAHSTVNWANTSVLETIQAKLVTDEIEDPTGRKGRTVAEYETAVDIVINEYFIANPQNMMGAMTIAREVKRGGLYRGDSQLCFLDDLTDVYTSLDKAISAMNGDVYKSSGTAANIVEHSSAKRRQLYSIKNGTVVNAYYNDNYGVVSENYDIPIITKIYGKVATSTANTLFATNVPNADQTAALNYVKMYCNAKKLILHIHATEGSSNEEDPCKEERKTLNAIYQHFVRFAGNNGSFVYSNSALIRELMKMDVEFPIFAALQMLCNEEHVNHVNGAITTKLVVEKAPILKGRIAFPVENPTKAESTEDAIQICLNVHGKIDLVYIATLLGNLDVEETKTRLLSEQLVFECPTSKLLVERDSYLSGNIAEKLLDITRSMSDSYELNRQALEEVLPAKLKIYDIFFSLKSRWIPVNIIERYAKEVLGISCSLSYNPSVDKYNYDSVYQYSSSMQFGTTRVDAKTIFLDILNMSPSIVYDTIDKARKRNDVESQAATIKKQQVDDMFVEWVRSSEELHELLEIIYNSEKNVFAVKKYEKARHTVVGLAGNFTPYSHQLRVVSRFLHQSGVCWHPVGSGKTRSIIMLAMEHCRLYGGKVLINVQNSTLGQFVSDAIACYPQAKILHPGLFNISDGKLLRTIFMQSAMTGDWNIVIAPGSFIDMIPDSPERIRELYIGKINGLLEAMEENGTASNAPLLAEVKKLQAKLDKEEKSFAKRVKESAFLEGKIEEQADRHVDNVVYFEQMGFTKYIIDEVHRYKKLGLQTKMQVKGIDGTASKRALSCFLKCRHIQEKSNGRGTVGFSGTVVSNTMAELWTFMNIFRPDMLKAYHVEQFDTFAADFGQVVSDWEMTPGGTYKVVDRFAQFINMPELLHLVNECMDIIINEDINEYKVDNSLPKLHDNGMTKVIVEMSDSLKRQINEYRLILIAYNAMTGADKAKNRHIPLVLFGKARQAAVSMALITGDEDDCVGEDTKTYHCIANCLKLYEEYNRYKATQLIFCDRYQHLVDGKADFNLYHYMRSELIKAGIPSREIAIIGDYTTDNAKEKLFADVNSGKIRFVFGSTEKLGTGVNVQERCIAVHHLDIPDRPSDYNQRVGRAERKGNIFAQLNILVHNYVYVVKNSLDVTAATRIKIKASFIGQVMSGKVSNRVTDDAADTHTSFSEIQAALMGEDGMKKFMIENRLKRIRMQYDGLKSQVVATRNQLEKTLIGTENVHRLLRLSLVANERIENAMPNGVVTCVSYNDTEYVGDNILEGIDNAINDNVLWIHNGENNTPNEKAVMVEINGFQLSLTTKYTGHLVKKSRQFDKNGVALLIDYTTYRTKYQILNYEAVYVGNPVVNGTIKDAASFISAFEFVMSNQASLKKRFEDLLVEQASKEASYNQMLESFPDKLQALRESMNELKVEMKAIDEKIAVDTEKEIETLKLEEIEVEFE